ncbi:MAG: tail fiber domain-containing protein [Pseudomonadota bacterium]
MSRPKTVAPPDPARTAAAQTGTNVSTALANSFLQNIDQVGPDGTRTFTEVGERQFTDPTSGATYTIPKLQETVSLSPEQQAIRDQNNEADLNLATLGNNLSSTLGDQLTSNFTINNESTENRLNELFRRQNDPLFAEQQEDLRTRLSNQGIKLGSDAYDRAFRNLTDAQGRQRNDALLRGRAQAANEQFAEDNQRINQINALQSGSQVSNPTFNNVNQPQLPTVDYAGLVNQNYQQRAANQAQNNAYDQQVLGGLFSLGSAFISDERAKGPMKKVGKLKGHNLYEYELKGKFDDGKKHIGVSAQEAEKKRPDAVKMASDGFRRVNYGSLFGMGA